MLVVIEPMVRFILLANCASFSSIKWLPRRKRFLGNSLVQCCVDDGGGYGVETDTSFAYSMARLPVAVFKPPLVIIETEASRTLFARNRSAKKQPKRLEGNLKSFRFCTFQRAEGRRIVSCFAGQLEGVP